MTRSTFQTAGRRAQAGFTLGELLAALAVSGVLAAVGMPQMGSLHGSKVVDGRVQSLMSSLRLARQEAVVRGETVSVCALDPASAEAGEPDCLPRGQDWSTGWIVFIDRGRRGEIGGGDRVVAIEQAATNGGALLGTARYVSYRPSGVLLSGMGHFRALPPGQPALDDNLPGAALVCLNKTGRPRLAAEPDCD